MDHGDDSRTAATDEPAEVYCICRSSDVNRFMIGCEACNEWFHGDCIKVTAEEAKFIKHWYCRACRKRNPSLHIKYTKKRSADGTAAPPPATTNSSRDTQHSPVDYQHKHKKYRPSGGDLTDRHRPDSDQPHDDLLARLQAEMVESRKQQRVDQRPASVPVPSDGVDQLLSAAAMSDQLGALPSSTTLHASTEEFSRPPLEGATGRHPLEGGTASGRQSLEGGSGHVADKHDHYNRKHDHKHRHDKRSDKNLKRLLHDRKKSSRMCGQCEACTRMVDCAVCDFCKDMRKFGGPNKLRQKCRLRQCLNYGLAVNVLNRDDSEPSFKQEHEQDRETDHQPHNKSTTLNGSQQQIQSSLGYVPQRAAAAAARKLTSEMRYHDDRLFEHREVRHSPARTDKKSHKELAHYEKRPRGRPPVQSGNVSGGHSSSVLSVADRRAAAAALSDILADDVPRQCYGPGCTQAARRGSKYCSDECGLQLANSRIFEILPLRIKQWQSSPCVADDNNRICLEKIRQRQLLAKEKLITLDKCRRDLDALIQRAKQCTVLPEPENADNEEEAELNVFCVTCGLEVGQRAALKHMEKCFNKFESQTSFGSIYKTRIEGDSMFCDYYNAQQGTYCKRLKVLCPEHLKEPKVAEDEVCGYPLVSNVFESTGEFCRVAKRKCNRHHAWEKLRCADIDMDRLRQWMLLDDLFEQERYIRSAMASRSGVLGLLLHQTIDHDPQHPLKQST